MANRTVVRFCSRPLLSGPDGIVTQILVTHHVELVLPGAHYLVRMLDGRVDTQGTIKDLRAQGILDEITHDEAVEVHKEEAAVATADAPATTEDQVAIDGAAALTGEQKKPRKLIKE